MYTFLVHLSVVKKIGLVSKVVPSDNLVDEAVKTASVIASMSQVSVQMAKEAINKCKYKKKLNGSQNTFVTSSIHFVSLRSSSQCWFALGTYLFPSSFWNCKYFYLIYILFITHKDLQLVYSRLTKRKA